MQVLNVIRNIVDPKQYLKKTPEPKDYKTLIKEDTIIYEDGKPIIIYKLIPKETIDTLRYLVFKSKFNKSARSNGLPTQSAIFGSLPRVPNRNNYCRHSANTRTQPELLKDILRFSEIIDNLYKELLPEQHEMNLDIVRTNVVEDYLIKDTPFTTVNLNVNHAIKYHKDTGNFKDIYSNVVIMKEAVEGGYLVCPEFDIAFEQCDGALILFDGQKIIHGVTPIRLTHPKGYRCSCVFYSLATMKNCYPYKKELERIKEWRDGVEGRWRSDPTALTGYNKAMKNKNKE